MNALVFILILSLSFTLYAKTEGGLKNIEGIGPKKQTRIIAAANDAFNALSQLADLNKPKPQAEILGNCFGFSCKDNGALVKSRKPANKKSAEKPPK